MPFEQNSFGSDVITASTAFLTSSCEFKISSVVGNETRGNQLARGQEKKNVAEESKNQVDS